MTWWNRMIRLGNLITGQDHPPVPQSADFICGPSLVWQNVREPEDRPLRMTFTVTEIIPPKKQAAPKGRRN